ncbi:MAG: hypothetical protein EOO02_20175 [Chitinophagaceae bacterium]|nr:MAG: hypothetical protein EOO02_20175 [Chitinophagaceae bacterium]
MQYMNFTKLKPMLMMIGICILMAACSKKTEEQPAPDRTESMKNTVWAGEYQLLAGDLLSLQPFSITLAVDGTLTWYDIVSTRPGGTWTMKQDTITITLPNNTVIAATVGTENWSNFKGGEAAGFLLSSVSAAKSAESSSLLNTKWTGILSGSKIDITILSDMMLSYKPGSGSEITIPYTNEGAGIRFSYKGIVSFTSNYLNISGNGTVMKGIEKLSSGFPSKTNYTTYAVTKL